MNKTEIAENLAYALGCLAYARVALEHAKKGGNDRDVLYHLKGVEHWKAETTACEALYAKHYGQPK